MTSKPSRCRLEGLSHPRGLLNQAVVRGQRQEVRKAAARRKVVEQLLRFRKVPAVIPPGAELLAQLAQLLVHDLTESLRRNDFAVVQLHPVVQPLPDLRDRITVSRLPGQGTLGFFHSIATIVP